MSMTELDSFFLRAAETERKLPAAFRKQKLASWPEYKQEWGAYGWDDFVAPLSQGNTGRRNKCFEQALLLGIRYMDEDDRRLVWAKWLTARRSASVALSGLSSARCLAAGMPGRLNACITMLWSDYTIRSRPMMMTRS